MCSLIKLWLWLYSHNLSTTVLACNSILIVYLSHHRDPHSTKTLQVFQDAIEWACSGSFSEKDVDEAKLSVFSQVKKLRECTNYGAHYFNARLSLSRFCVFGFCMYFLSLISRCHHLWQVQKLWNMYGWQIKNTHTHARVVQMIINTSWHPAVSLQS